MIRGPAPSPAACANALLTRAWLARTRKSTALAAFRPQWDETDKADTLPPYRLREGTKGVGPSLRTLVNIRAKLTHAKHGQLRQLPLARPPPKRTAMLEASRAQEGPLRVQSAHALLG